MWTTIVCRSCGEHQESMEQQQQRGKATDTKDTNSTEEKPFQENDQNVSEKHTMHPQDHTVGQQRVIKSIVFSDDLFDKWPPPADMEGRLDAQEIEQIKAEMRGRPMQGPRSTAEDLKEWGLTCVEQYHIYDIYCVW